MPFQPRSLSTIPAIEPDVKILFNGQLLLRSEDGLTCDVAVNPFATDHVLSIEVRVKIAGQDDLIGMRHFGPLHLRASEGMSIEVDNPPAIGPAIWKCVTTDPIDYAQGTNPPPDTDFRWLLNLEGPLFHGRALETDIFKTKHVIRLRNGEYFFRTAALSEPRLEYHRTGGGKAPFTFRKIGTTASASVFLINQQQVVLKWNDDNDEQALTLEKAPNTTYEIYIENAPLFQDSPPESELVNYDEFVEYYKVIPKVLPCPEGTRFKLVPAHHDTGGGNEGSPTIPCQVIILDGPGT